MPQLDEALALVAARAGDEAEVVVGDAAARGTRRRARRSRSARPARGRSRRGAPATTASSRRDDVAMQRGVAARARSLLDLAVAEDHVRVRRLEALDLARAAGCRG